MASPAETLASSAVFVIDRAGLKTVTMAVLVTGGWLSALAVAVLEYTLTFVSNDVVLKMCTENDAPGARLPRAQFRTWLPTAPLMLHFGSAVSCQLTPGP